MIALGGGKNKCSQFIQVKIFPVVIICGVLFYFEVASLQWIEIVVNFFFVMVAQKNPQ